jgi:inositol-1,4,5-trisphosphate 5-phosphatase
MHQKITTSSCFPDVVRLQDLSSECPNPLFFSSDSFHSVQVTYNTNGREPTEPLHDMLGFNSDFYGSHELPDVLVIGLQEVSMHLSSIIISDPWTREVDKVLFPWDFVRIRMDRMHGLLLLMYCKRSIMTMIRDLISIHTKTGLSQLIGSKGAVSISCKISGTSFVITCAHLSAHQAKFEHRLRDYATIIDEQVFHNDRQANRILSHDYAIFMGDLNFRINHMTEDQVHERATSVFLSAGHRTKAVREILESDQLRIAMKEGLAFSEFQEPDVSFMPTYKFIVGSSQYDLSRIPALTDRILFRYCADAYEHELPGLKLHLSPLRYTSHPIYTISDHKPVSALFIFKAFNRKAYESEKSKLIEPTRVSFLPINFRNGQENAIFFTLSSKSRQLTCDDFVAIFRSDFTCLAQEIQRSYVNPSQETNVSPPRVHDFPDHHVHTVPWFRITFSENVHLLPSPATYCMLYISSRFNDVLGISPPFDVK